MFWVSPPLPSSTSGQSFFTSWGEMIWNGTPMVLAVPQYF